MKIEYLIYTVTDSHGNKDATVCNESSDTIQICGMKNKDNGDTYFESDAYHLKNWCEENNFELNTLKMDAHV